MPNKPSASARSKALSVLAVLAGTTSIAYADLGPPNWHVGDSWVVDVATWSVLLNPETTQLGDERNAGRFALRVTIAGEDAKHWYVEYSPAEATEAQKAQHNWLELPDIYRLTVRKSDGGITEVHLLNPGEHSTGDPQVVDIDRLPYLSFTSYPHPFYWAVLPWNDEAAIAAKPEGVLLPRPDVREESWFTRRVKVQPN